MQLRLKKNTDTKWDNHWDISPGKMVLRDEGKCFYSPKPTGKMIEFYHWNTENKYQTEYRKMRLALIEYLTPEPSVVPKRLITQLMKDEWVEPEILIEEMAVKITQLEAAHIALTNKMMDATEMIVDLRTQLRQSEERNKMICLENYGLINATNDLKMGYMAQSKNNAMVEAAKLALTEGYSAKRDMMVQEIRKDATKAQELIQ